MASGASQNFSEIAFKMFYKHYFRGTSMHPLKRVYVQDRSQNISKGGAKSRKRNGEQKFFLIFRCKRV